MRKRYLELSVLFLSILFFGCSSDKRTEEIIKDSHLTFLQAAIELPATAGEGTLSVEWAYAEWKIEFGEGAAIISDMSQFTGGDLKGEKQIERIKFTYRQNLSLESRSQEVFLVNTATNERTKLVVEQKSKYESTKFTLHPSVEYQHVVGFGGMYNPKIWLGANNLITIEEVDRMFGQEGDDLGYNMLRLMVYPKESDWAADVEGAKRAQQHGAIVFAAPWDCTDELSETITENGREYKHLKKDNYQAYTDHLVRYINFMKSNGVDIAAISVQNEPDMEFTFWRPHEVVDYVKRFGDQIKATGVKLMAPETCGMHPDYTDPIMNDQEAFNNTDIIAGHLYQGFIDIDASGYVKNRHAYICNLYPNKLKAAGKTWWMTEHLFNDGEKESNSSLWKFQDWYYNLETLGQEIHMCMEGYCSAYVYWYLKRFYGMMGDHDERSLMAPGQVSKNGFILSHYAKYASNMTRIKIDTGQSDVMATAYINDQKDEMTVVFVNLDNKFYNVQISSPQNVVEASAVRTTEVDNVRATVTEISENSKDVSVLVEARSIVSLRLKL